MAIAGGGEGCQSSAERRQTEPGIILITTSYENSVLDAESSPNLTRDRLRAIMSKVAQRVSFLAGILTIQNHFLQVSTLPWCVELTDAHPPFFSQENQGSKVAGTAPEVLGTKENTSPGHD